MISHSQYFGVHKGHRDITPKITVDADKMLTQVNMLLEDFVRDGGILKINPTTKSYISGQTYGGFRPLDCPLGTPASKHKRGMAVDITDRNNELDDWIMAGPKAPGAGWPLILVKYDLALEHPNSTNRWCHLQLGAPPSGNRVFIP